MTFVGIITFQVLACKGFDIEKAVNAIVASTLILDLWDSEGQAGPPLVYFGG